MQQTWRIDSIPQEWIYIPDVQYRVAEGVMLRIQLIVPCGAGDGRFPLAVYIPGTAWHRQEMYNKLPTLSNLAQRGVAVAAVQVRASEEAVFPAQVEDVRAAVGWLRTNGAQFGIDPDRLYLLGDSSGGHSALMTLLMTDGLPVRGVAAISAPTDILLCAKAPTPPGMFPEGKPTECLLGVRDIPAHAELARLASCGPYITERALPPVLLIHGTADSVVNVAHSRQLYRQLKQAGHPAELIEVEGENHGSMAYWSGKVQDRMLRFLNGEE